MFSNAASFCIPILFVHKKTRQHFNAKPHEITYLIGAELEGFSIEWW